MWIVQVDQDSHSFSGARVEYGLQQAGKAEWRESVWYRQLCLGNHWMEFRSRVEVSQRIIRYRAGYRRRRNVSAFGVWACWRYAPSPFTVRRAANVHRCPGRCQSIINVPAATSAPRRNTPPLHPIHTPPLHTPHSTTPPLHHSITSPLHTP